MADIGVMIRSSLHLTIQRLVYLNTSLISQCICLYLPPSHHASAYLHIYIEREEREHFRDIWRERERERELGRYSSRFSTQWIIWIGICLGSPTMARTLDAWQARHLRTGTYGEILSEMGRCTARFSTQWYYYIFLYLTISGSTGRYGEI